MVSLAQDLKDFISEEFVSYAPIQTDVLTDDSESICLRIDPGNAAESRYLTGKRVGRCNFSLFCKSESKERAINQLWDYINGLDLTEVLLTDNANISTEPITEPHFVSKSENGELIYTASFSMEYEYNG